LELTKETQVLTDELERLKCQIITITTETGNTNYHIRLKIFTNREEKVCCFTDIIQLIQFESPELLVKIFREVHLFYSCMNLS